jgi:hypothetical protein
VPDASTLPGPIAAIVQHFYGTGLAEIFLVAAALGIGALIALAFMHEAPLGAERAIDIAEAEALAA